MSIKFGTDGWRAIVGESFTKENVELVTKAIGKYVFDNYGIYKPIIVGYDPRNMADEFSKYCAEILSDFRKFNGTKKSYYAEKFGYDRFFMAWENDNPFDIAITQTIAEFQYDGTKKLAGGAATAQFPNFMGAVIKVIEE